MHRKNVGDPLMLDLVENNFRQIRVDLAKIIGKIEKKPQAS